MLDSIQIVLLIEIRNRFYIGFSTIVKLGLIERFSYKS